METTVNNDIQKLLPVGTVLNGKYKILKQLSSRALGNLYLANDTKFRENVLIKELFVQNISKRTGERLDVTVDDSCTDIYNEYLDRFNEEARALRQINNAHVAKVTDLFSENNTSYYVLENVEGELLSQKMVRRNKPFGEAETLSYLTQMLDGLNAMHSQGFWHLDITPSNVIVDDNANVRFLEFGHCKLVDNESTIVADTNHDPMELQALDENNIGPWTDYYSLGATLYNLLTGKRPPAAAEVNEATTNLYHFPTSVSKKMQRLILWMMTPNIFRRPQDANEIHDFLYGFTATNATDKAFEKNLAAAGEKKKPEKVKSQLSHTATDSDTDDDDDDDDGLSNRTLKGMQIFIFLAILGILGYFAYKTLFGHDDAKRQSARNGLTIKEEEKKSESKVDTRSDVDVLAITSEEEEAKKKEEEAKKEAAKKQEEEQKRQEAKAAEEKAKQEDKAKQEQAQERKEQSQAENQQAENRTEPAADQKPAQTDAASSQAVEDHAAQGKDKQQEQAKPAQTQAPANDSHQAEPKKKYNVIVGSFSSQENANTRVDELKSQGYSATVRFSDSNKMYRVVVTNADESTKDKLKARYSDAWVE